MKSRHVVSQWCVCVCRQLVDKEEPAATAKHTWSFGSCSGACVLAAWCQLSHVIRTLGVSVGYVCERLGLKCFYELLFHRPLTFLIRAPCKYISLNPQKTTRACCSHTHIQRINTIKGNEVHEMHRSRGKHICKYFRLSFVKYNI